ncbi:hypothetical protein BGZ65_007655 [Modicella reniformis]|uniref:Uncharacterized protein n=1 Tax=Modicella reniformis TaxID=1440133 RepID=A0A9P6IQY9_9FUNG|nr:hypothetical protein BGZ65_007655 [Modicella reniformis]
MESHRPCVGLRQASTIRNCFRHVPILCDKQRDELCKTNADETRPPPIDQCLLEAILRDRNIDDLMDLQSNGDAEGTLEIPYQHIGMLPSLDASSLQVSEARKKFDRDTERARVAVLSEDIRRNDVMRRRVNKEQAREGYPGLQRRFPPLKEVEWSRTHPFNTCGRDYAVSDAQRDRATTLAAALDGSPFLCKLIEEYSRDETFMSYFKPKPSETVLLGDEWLPENEDMSDGDYSMSSTDDTDAVSKISESDNTGDEGVGNDQEHTGEMDGREAHDVLMRASQIVSKDYPDLQEQLETVADAMLGTDVLDADDTYISQFNEDLQRQQELHQRMHIHTVKLKKKYPGVKFPVMTLGTVACTVEDMEMSEQAGPSRSSECHPLT